MPDLWAEDVWAKQNAPSKPYLTDEWQATDQTLWLRVLQVAKGRKRQMTRVGPNGPRTIHAPNHGHGFRHWPSQKAVAWAVKQYNGYGGKWKGHGEEATTASDEAASLYTSLLGMKMQLDQEAHTLNDVVEGRVQIGIEGNSGQDMPRAKRLGLFTCNVKGVDIYARCEEDARPLILYLEQGGSYGSLEFSRLLGYTDQQIDLYRRYLLLSAEVPQPEGFSPFQREALERMSSGSILTTPMESGEYLGMTSLENRGLVQLVQASEARAEAYWDITEQGLKMAHFEKQVP